MNTALTEEIKSLVLNTRADLVGVAPVERSGLASAETSPAHYLPSASSAISIGVRITDGVIDI